MVGVGIGNIAYRIKGMYNNSGMKIYSIKGHGTVIQIFLIIVVNKKCRWETYVQSVISR